MIDRREMGGVGVGWGIRKKERETSSFILSYTSVAHDESRVSNHTQPVAHSPVRTRARSVRQSVIHGHVHIIISRGRPRDSRRGSTDRECHSASGLFAPLPLALFQRCARLLFLSQPRIPVLIRSSVLLQKLLYYCSANIFISETSISTIEMGIDSL